VVGVDGRRLSAVDPAGTLKWTLARPSPVHRPAWSRGEGFAVAYLEGATLRAVAGNGDPATDRQLRNGAAAVTPAWRPGSDRVLAFVTRDGAVEAVDAESGRTLWRASFGRIVGLGWSRNARRLVALSSRSVSVLRADGRRLVTVPLPDVARELAVHPSGTRAAVVVGRRGEARVIEVPLEGAAAPGGATRQLFQGDVDGLAWSEDGRRLLLGWRGAGQWLVIGPGDRIRALHDVSRELGAPGGFPRVAGWCCSAGG
jgi:outer membrane protein assembly factor BamB